MRVTRQYTLPVRAFMDSLAGTIRLRLTRKSAAPNSIDLSGADVEDAVSLPQRDGRVLVAGGFAAPCNADLPHPEGTNTDGATVSASVGLPDDWDLVTTCSFNTLLVGPPHVARTFVQALAAQLRTPIVTIRPDAPLVLPPVGEVGTLILNDVAALDPEDQQRLLDWLNRSRGQTRAISTSSMPLVTKVTEGKFLEALYYRLNTVYVTLAERRPPVVSAA